MGFFSKILAKLGLGEAAAAPSQATSKAPTASGATSPATPATSGMASTAAQPAAVPMVDVVAQLEKSAAANSQKLNWRTSIVDLLKLLNIDSSLPARKELAAELGCPSDLMEDSAKMNIWLHKAVLARIAANGGNVPRELLD